MSDFDTSEIRALAADLGRAHAAVVPLVERVAKKGAQNIKDEWVRQVSGSARLRHYPRSISYDRAFTLTGVEYEIGPDKDRMQGALGNIAEFGTSRHGPVAPGGGAALGAEAPRFEKAIGEAVEDVL